VYAVLATACLETGSNVTFIIAAQVVAHPSDAVRAPLMARSVVWISERVGASDIAPITARSQGAHPRRRLTTRLFKHFVMTQLRCARHACRQIRHQRYGQHLRSGGAGRDGLMPPVDMPTRSAPQCAAASESRQASRSCGPSGNPA